MRKWMIEATNRLHCVGVGCGFGCAVVVLVPASVIGGVTWMVVS